MPHSTRTTRILQTRESLKQRLRRLHRWLLPPRKEAPLRRHSTSPPTTRFAKIDFAVLLAALAGASTTGSRAGYARGVFAPALFLDREPYATMPKPKVFVTRIIPEAGLKRSANSATPTCGATVAATGRRAQERIADCDGLLSLLTERIDGRLLDAAPRLKVVSNYAVGFNNIDMPAATERGIAVGNTPGVLTDATADMAFCAADLGRAGGLSSRSITRTTASGKRGSRSGTSARTWSAGRSASSAWAASAWPWPSAAMAAGDMQRAVPRPASERRWPRSELAAQPRRTRHAVGGVRFHFGSHRSERHHARHVQRRRLCQR